MVAIAPALAIGLVTRRSFSSTAITELNGMPVLFTPSFSRATSAPSASHTRAKTNGLETLWMENGAVASPAVTSSPDVATMHAPNRFGSAAASAGM